MSEIKEGYRNVENKTREVLRRSDGDESIADKVGNVGDDIRDDLGNLGDDVREGLDDLTDDVRREIGEAAETGREAADRP